MRNLTIPSYLFDLKVHLHVSLRKDQVKDQQSHIKLSLNQKKKKEKKIKLKGIGAMRKCKKLLLYGKKKNSKHEKYYNKDEKQKA